MVPRSQLFLNTNRLRLNRQCTSGSLLKKKPTQRTEITKDPAAFVYVELKFFHVIQSERNASRRRTRFPLDAPFDVSLCLYETLGQ